MPRGSSTLAARKTKLSPGDLDFGVNSSETISEVLNSETQKECSQRQSRKYLKLLLHTHTHACTHTLLRTR